MNKLIIFAILIVSHQTVKAQGPANDNPCAATPLPVNNNCVFSTYTNAGSTGTTGAPAPGCAAYQGEDVWFSLTVPASGMIDVDFNTGGITDAGAAAYTGTCTFLNLIDCDDDSSPNGLMPLLNLSGLTPGTTVWIRVWEFGGGTTGTFDICAVDPTGGGGGGPTNDNPCMATPIAVNATCIFSTYTNEAATNTNGAPNPGCASYQGEDVWFSLVVPLSGMVDVDFNTGVITDAGAAAYTGSCTALTLIDCDDDSSPNGLMPLLNLTGLTPGSTVWIRVWEFAGGTTGTFDICAVDPDGGGGVDCSTYIGDDQEDAIPVGALPYTDNHSNVICYTDEHPIYVSPDVYYLLEASSIEGVTVSLCGSAFDTYLTITDKYGNILNSNDDYAGCGNTSQAIVATAGIDSVYIIVEGWGDATGDYELTITEEDLSLNPLATNSISLYPNPTESSFTILGLEHSNYDMKIIDLNGRTKREILDMSGNIIDVSGFPSGIYMVHIIVDDELIVKKLAVK